MTMHDPDKAWYSVPVQKSYSWGAGADFMAEEVLARAPQKEKPGSPKLNGTAGQNPTEVMFNPRFNLAAASCSSISEYHSLIGAFGTPFKAQLCVATQIVMCAKNHGFRSFALCIWG